MNDITKLAVALFATTSLTLVGCGGSDRSFSPVSGKVTSDGAPVAAIRVVFTPEPTDGNNSPGPWSMGLTNAQGEYTLESRHGKDGAVPGPHGVSFEYDDMSGDAEEELLDDLEEARGEDGSKEEVDEVRKRMAELKQKQKGRPRVSDEFSIEFVVPQGGTTEANFDLPAK